MRVLVIHEIDHKDDMRAVIGVADCVVQAEKLIGDHYIEYEVLSYDDIRDSNLEWLKRLRIKWPDGFKHEVTVWLEWFELNEC